MIRQITLQAARINANLSLQEAARQIGVTSPTLLGYERGVQIPRVNAINKILDLYGISYADINWRPGAWMQGKQHPKNEKRKRTLKELRKNMGLRKDEAAKRLGISLSTVYAYEHADRLPDVDMIEKILATYNVKYEEIKWHMMPAARQCEL